MRLLINNWAKSRAGCERMILRRSRRARAKSEAPPLPCFSTFANCFSKAANSASKSGPRRRALDEFQGLAGLHEPLPGASHVKKVPHRC